MKYTEHVAEVVEDNKKWNLDELVTAFREISTAKAAGKTKRGTFPALTTIAATIRKGEFDRLTPEVWGALADFLEGRHRRKRGVKINSIARQDDENLYNAIVKFKTEQILHGRHSRGLTTEAKERLLEKHKRLDARALDRSLSRHISRKLKAVEAQMVDEKTDGTDFMVVSK